MRQRKARLFPVALSPSAAAESMKLPLRVIREAIYSTGELEAYIVGNNRVRIPVESLVRWLKTKPRATLLQHNRSIRS